MEKSWFASCKTSHVQRVSRELFAIFCFAFNQMANCFSQRRRNKATSKMLFFRGQLQSRSAFIALAQREMERHFFANRWARARRFCARRSPFRTRLAMNTKFAGWKIETSSAYGAAGRRVFVVSVSRFIRASLIAAFRTSQKVVLICVIESGDAFLPAPPINNTRESTHDAFMNKSSPRAFVTAALKGACLKIETHQSLGLFASWARVSLRARLAVFQRAPFIVGYSARTPV